MNKPCLSILAPSKSVFRIVVERTAPLLKPEDERLTSTLANLGDVSYLLSQYEQADKFYSKAYAISKQFHKGELAVRQTGKHYADNCRKLGKTDLADELSDQTWQGIDK